jgi:hypothetical protein
MLREIREKVSQDDTTDYIGDCGAPLEESHVDDVIKNNKISFFQETREILNSGTADLPDVHNSGELMWNITTTMEDAFYKASNRGFGSLIGQIGSVIVLVIYIILAIAAIGVFISLLHILIPLIIVLVIIKIFI